MQEEYLILSVEEALNRMLAALQPLSSERIPVLEILGRMITEDAFSGMGVPPLANSAMDGYAVRAVRCNLSRPTFV